MSKIKAWIILAVIILVLIIGSYFLFFQDDEGNTNNSNATITANENVNTTTNVDSDWLTYENKEFGFSVQYPSKTDVIEKQDEGVIEFRGQVQQEGGGRWPRYFITHRFNDFYNPPEGTDLEKWINLDSSDKMVEGYQKIAGLDALHVIYNATPQSKGGDFYYLIK